MALDPELMKNDKIQIIKLPPERWKDYRSLRLRALKDDPQAFGRSYAEEASYSDEKWQEKTNDTVLFASDGKNLIGVMGTYQSDVDKENKTANVFGVYVAPEFRGKGISKMLMQALIDELKSNTSISKLKLKVNKNQLSAVKLYEAFGFKTIKEEKALLGDGNYYDEYLMEKDL